jgi:hypothetical protein
MGRTTNSAKAMMLRNSVTVQLNFTSEYWYLRKNLFSFSYKTFRHKTVSKTKKYRATDKLETKGIYLSSTKVAVCIMKNQ